MSFVANPAKDGETTWKYFLLGQDLFSRKLFAETLVSTSGATAAFERILDRSGRKPRELNTDKDTAFLSQEFQNLLARKGIAHRKRRL